ncbi:MAG: hypothetical protein HKP40_00575 [Litoreibacter sp.]|nr:hypothetical protein [Litoreibacter sp.]
MMIELLGGVVLAVMVFSALMWTLYSAVVLKGRSRLVRVFLILATVGGMASLSFASPATGAAAGAGLIIFGAIALWQDAGWSKLLPAAQIAFGAALIFGLPWQGA